jgi:F-box/leucine-rich repeat protein 10/11
MGDPGRWVAIANSRPMKPHNFRRLKGEELNLDWVMSDPSAFLEPIIIESPDGLDMTMPNPSMTVRKVAEVVGTETPVEVMGASAAIC